MLQQNDEIIGLYNQNPYLLKMYNSDGTFLKYVGENKRDSIIGHVATYHTEATYDLFFQTKNYLKLLTSEGVLSKQVNRFSFLPGTMLSDLFYPIGISENGKLEPALYLDGTGISSNYVTLIKKAGGALISPIKNSMHIPKSCRPLNPVFDMDTKNYKYIMICTEDGSSEMMDIAI